MAVSYLYLFTLDGMSVDPEKVYAVRENRGMTVQKGSLKLPGHSELPEALLKLTYMGGRTTKRASEK